ncbi:MAG: indole-3-glycerol phosphate synthase TrpC [Thermodesulfobacteriota bacterium]
MKTDFLNRIVADRKLAVAAARNKIPENRLREEAFRARSRRPFRERLARPGPFGINIIAEIKRASPSRGMILSDLDPVRYARYYERGGAAAISVLTEEIYFHGGVADLTAARAAVSLPVLRKDFIVSAYQLYESALLNADAVLLIVRILSRQQLQEYLDLCRRLQLETLVEVHSEKDIETASWAGAELIGINNRNLSSFKTDTQTAVRMKSLLQPQQVAVAASGIATRQDVEKNLQAGLWNFLIGESLVRAPDPENFLKTLMQPQTY